MILRAQGGLCNRLRAVLSGASCAEASGRSYAFGWVIGPSFGARFDELWDHPHRQISSRTTSVLARLVGGYTPRADVPVDSSRRLIVTNSNEVIAADEPGTVAWIERLRRLPL